MQTAFVLAALAGAALAAPQASASVAAGLPSSLGPAPAGCSASYNGQFEITIVKPSNLKRDIAERQDGSCGTPGILTLQLQNGNLTDNDGRTGYIASANSQFQFDKPVQAGGIFAGNFSVCNNGSIALGPTTTFYQCQSGGFFNLYYTADAQQCSPVNIDIIPCNAQSSSASVAAPSTKASAAAVSTSAKPVSVSSDGQPQATAKATSVVPVSVFSDGQPQATAAATSIKPAVVSEFTDGQPQATAAATAKSNVTAAAPKPTIATAGGSSIAASISMAGLMAAFALLF